MRRLLGSVCFSLAVYSLSAQEIDLEQFAERLFQVQTEDVSYEDIYESLLLFYTDPVNLNRADAEELSSLFILSPVQVQELIKHREAYGDLISIYELQAVPYFDLGTIEHLLPFVTVDEISGQKRPLWERILKEENKYFLFRHSRVFEKQQGYLPTEENGYLGSRDKLYGRFRVSKRNDFSFGFTFEKDAGERFENQGFDFYSFHGLLENQGPFSQIIIGDFQLQVGQGLVFGSGFNPGKGAETVNTVKRNTIGLRPYTSVLETGFFRGSGVSVRFRKFQLTGFGSRLLQDGNVKTDTIDSQFEVFVNSIQSSGLHRTMNEQSSKDQVVESNFGGFLTFRPSRNIMLGFSGLATSFDQPILPSEFPYKRFDFSGSNNQLGSFFGNYQWNNLNFFGEVARSSSGGAGLVSGVLASLSRTLDVAISLRNYRKDFHSFYGNGFGETASLRNEQGVYWGVKWAPSRRFSLVAYYDKFKFPWLRFGVDSPSEGAEWLSRFTYQPDRDISMFVQVREERKGVSISEANLSTLVDRIRRNYIFNIDFKASSALSLKTRLQTSSQDEAGVFTSGYALIQDVNYRIGRFRMSGRFALFETDDFDNRQYVYERDVLFAFSIPAYNGSGIRNYLLVRYEAFSNLDFWIRYGRFSYRDRDTVGSGLDESEGPIRTELKWMIRWMF